MPRRARSLRHTLRNRRCRSQGRVLVVRLSMPHCSPNRSIEWSITTPSSTPAGCCAVSAAREAALADRKKAPPKRGHEEFSSRSYCGLACGDAGGVVAGGVTEGAAGGVGAGALCVGALLLAVRTLSLL